VLGNGGGDRGVGDWGCWGLLGPVGACWGLLGGGRSTKSCVLVCAVSCCAVENDSSSLDLPRACAPDSFLGSDTWIGCVLSQLLTRFHAVSCCVRQCCVMLCHAVSCCAVGL
jgi:hypothetical protein